MKTKKHTAALKRLPNPDFKPGTARLQLQKIFPGMEVLFSQNALDKPIVIDQTEMGLSQATELRKRNIRIDAAQQGVSSFDPRIVEIRTFKETFRLTSNNLIELLSLQGFEISRTSLSAYLQGNVKGTDVRHGFSAVGRKVEVDHVTDLYAEFKKLEIRYSAVFKQLLSTDMRSLMDSWYQKLDIFTGSKERQLSKIVGIEFTSLFKWYQKNEFPMSIKTLLVATEKIQKHLASIRA
jgi:hypothetical protein